MTLLEEMLLAGRGLFAVVQGRRDASRYFDLTTRGLVGSFVAFLIATTANAFLPVFTGAQESGLQPSRALFMVITLYFLQIGCSTIVLNQIKRLDGLVPYMVADNWATFFVTFITMVLGFAGIDGDGVFILVGILVLAITINIARLIVTLKPLQIAMFLIAQLVGVTIGLIILGSIMPMPNGVESVGL